MPSDLPIEDDARDPARLARSGLANRVDDWLIDLRRDGYVVRHGAVPVEMCDAVIDAIATELGIVLDDPETWARISTEIDQVPLWAHQSQWDIRQLPNLCDAWSTIWGRRDLWADMNSCRVTPPWQSGRADALDVHFDVDPRDQSQQWYPGIVALTDAGEREGGFRCAPSLFRERDRWPHEWPASNRGVEYKLPVIDDEIVEMPLRKGDVLIMDSHLPHGTVRNTSTTPRAVFYMQLHPPGNDHELAQRLADVDAGRCPSWWRWKPGHDRLDPPLRPLSLTPLGRRLLGIEPW